MVAHSCVIRILWARGPSALHNTTGRLWIEEGEQREGVVAEVAPILRTHKTYNYAVPQEIENGLTLGRRVSVPMGRKGKPVQGFVVKLDRLDISTLRNRIVRCNVSTFAPFIPKVVSHYYRGAGGHFLS